MLVGSAIIDFMPSYRARAFTTPSIRLNRHMKAIVTAHTVPIFIYNNDDNIICLHTGAHARGVPHFPLYPTLLELHIIGVSVDNKYDFP